MIGLSFRGFCEDCERVAATTSKNRKVSLMAGYLRGLEGDALAIASRFLAGRVFPKGSGLEVNLGYRSILRALRDLTGLREADLLEVYRRYGDLGETAEMASLPKLGRG